MRKEELLMEEIELCEEQCAFAIASQRLAGKIRESAQRVGYDLNAACTLVENGKITVLTLLPPDESGVMGFVGLPVEVGLYLTSSACGGMFPQMPTQPEAA